MTALVGVMRLAMVPVLLLVFAPAASAQLPPGFPGACEAPECTVIAGTGEEVTGDDDRGDNGPATAATFGWVDGLDWAGNGHILVADGTDARIRRITPSGNIVTNYHDEDDDEAADGVAHPIAVVSTASYPTDPFERHAFITADVADDTVEDWGLLISPLGAFSWSGAVAMEEIDAFDIEAKAAGPGFWVADPGGLTVWSLFFNDFLHRWTQAPALENVEARGVGPLPGGGFLVASATLTPAPDCRIRRRTDNGTVVIAGSGFCAGRENGANGDGGPATASHLGFPQDVEPTADGGFVMIERERVRHVDADGTISTLFVTGISSPDFPAPQPSALEVTPDGDVLIGLERRVLRFDTNYGAAPTPTPTPTATSTAGPNPVPPPPQPQPVQPVVTTLTAKLSKSSYKVVQGKKLALAFNAAGAGKYVLAIKKGKKLAKQFKGAVKPGKNTVKKKLKLKPGKYKLALTLSIGGQVATDTANLRVKRSG